MIDPGSGGQVEISEELIAIAGWKENFRYEGEAEQCQCQSADGYADDDGAKLMFVLI